MNPNVMLKTIGAVLIVSVVTVGVVGIFAPQASGTIGMILGLVVPTVASMFAMLKAEEATTASKVNTHKLEGVQETNRAQTEKLTDVQQLVNGQREAMLAEIAALKKVIADRAAADKKSGPP